MQDPDPYGVKALQAEGLEIREAGTNCRPSAEVFEFKPAATSPVYSNFRRSLEVRERANSWRGSMHSIASVDKGTQTEEADSRSASHSPKKRTSQQPSPIRQESEHVQESSKDGEKVHGLESSVPGPSQIETAVPVVARARMVTVPKRVPPSLPPRNPSRTSSLANNEKDGDGFDTVSLNASEHSDATPEQKKSDAEPEHSTDQAQLPLTEGNPSPGMNGVPPVTSEDGFRSVPSSPGTEHLHVIPGAF